MQRTTVLTTVNLENSKSRTFSFLSTFNTVTENHIADISTKKNIQPNSSEAILDIATPRDSTTQIITVGKHCTSLEGTKEQVETYLVD